MTLVDATSRIIGDQAVGPIGFGCWRFVHADLASAQATLEAALDAGMNLIDNADVYGLDHGGAGFGANESLLGSVLEAAPALRDRMVLATKGGIAPPTPYNSGSAALRTACEASLGRLRTEVIDLYLVHRPDLYTHPHDVADTLVELQVEGKVRHLGVSNHTPAQVAALSSALADRGSRLVSIQPELSVVAPAAMRDGTLDQAMELRLVPLAWSPLGGGRLLSGEGVRIELFNVLDRLADREGVDRAAVALAWVLAHPSRVVTILGSQNPAHIAAAQQALTVHLDRADCYDVLVASEGVPLP